MEASQIETFGFAVLSCPQPPVPVAKNRQMRTLRLYVPIPHFRALGYEDQWFKRAQLNDLLPGAASLLQPEPLKQLISMRQCMARMNEVMSGCADALQFVR